MNKIAKMILFSFFALLSSTSWATWNDSAIPHDDLVCVDAQASAVRIDGSIYCKTWSGRRYSGSFTGKGASLNLGANVLIGVLSSYKFDQANEEYDLKLGDTVGGALGLGAREIVGSDSDGSQLVVLGLEAGILGGFTLHGDLHIKLKRLY